MQIFEKNILGCFVMTNMDDDEGKVFLSYIWGDDGIGEILKPLKYEKYGSDLTIILFKFYVNPIPQLQGALKEIERYRKDERAIGIPIIVNDKNFFYKSEIERKKFITESILQKLELLKDVVKKKKLDTDMGLLKSDVEEILKRYFNARL